MKTEATALVYRDAAEADLPVLIAMLAEDALGASREDPSSPLNPRYLEAYRHIAADPNNALMVVEENGAAVGMLQLTFIPYLTHTGSWRCLIEGVRIHRDHRGRGLGSEFMRWAIERAREHGCSIVQLTSDKQRPDALRFYEALGFSASHEGFKLRL
ncbi:MAG TPA: GNAT family N-acetyltransferase [Gammaproteobacteria bacterium]|jgi:ribosomal protein S18 acetylase RimI-like enzyme